MGVCRDAVNRSLSTSELVVQRPCFDADAATATWEEELDVRVVANGRRLGALAHADFDRPC